MSARRPGRARWEELSPPQWQSLPPLSSQPTTDENKGLKRLGFSLPQRPSAQASEVWGTESAREGVGAGNAGHLATPLCVLVFTECLRSPGLELVCIKAVTGLRSVWYVEVTSMTRVTPFQEFLYTV